MRVSKVNCSFLPKEKYRLEGKYYLNDFSLLSMVMENNASRCIPLGNVATLFNPNIFKRQFCCKTPKSVPYFQSSDVPTIFEDSYVHIFGKQADVYNLRVNRGDILITGFGTIGDTRIVSRQHQGACYGDNVCRAIAKDSISPYFLYAFLSSKYATAQMEKKASGSVVRYIKAPQIKTILFPVLGGDLVDLISEKVKLALEEREEGNDLMAQAWSLFCKESGLESVDVEEYEHYGSRRYDRVPGIRRISVKEMGTLTINAFNHSKRIQRLTKRITDKCKCVTLRDMLSDDGFFSTGSFPRIETPDHHGVELINQSDIFNTRIKGKWISKRGVKVNNLVSEHEILIAGVGTLGESESFCRCVYANKKISGQLVSGEFIRMKTAENKYSGYLYLWLNSDFGFRLIRSTQAGTKLCRPIQELLGRIPVPIVDESVMQKIDDLVKQAQEKYFKSTSLEENAIEILEQTIDGWDK